MIEIMDYIAYLEAVWTYFPFILYSFVFVTLLPKSFMKIKTFADADYEANRHKYHRCYGPEICCHTMSKPKQRKAVTRVYPKKSSITDMIAPFDTTTTGSNIKRQVQASAIQTRTNVNKIAKMFENGNTTTTTTITSTTSTTGCGSGTGAGAGAGATIMANMPMTGTIGLLNKKINRVIPTMLPEIRMPKDNDYEIKKPASQLLRENIENSVNSLLKQVADDDDDTNNWHGEALTPIQRHKRSLPNTLTYAGTSTTPSTASPVASTPHSSPHSSPPLSPVLRTMAPLNMKSSFEDIFAAIARNAENNEGFMTSNCNSLLSPVTSIDDILSQRRLSRPLSAYSISDLLNDEHSPAMDEVYMENFLHALNKTSA